MTIKITHLDSKGNAQMVDVGHKASTHRMAIAKGEIILNKQVLNLIREKKIKKGDVFTVAQIAGIQAAKKTYELIPLCHPILIQQIEVEIDFLPNEPGVGITATVRSSSQTGVEMEALVAVSVAGLTIYDMIKSVQKDASLQNIRLLEKHGGIHGDVINA
jgi:cyclic pyranopterin phosphate synthase